MWRTRRIILATVVAMSAAVSNPVAPETLAAESRTVILGHAFRNPADGVLRTLPGMTVTFSVGADLWPVYASAQVTAASSTRANILQSARITCSGPDGHAQYMRTDRNNEGFDAYGGRPLRVPVRFLYRPSVAGIHSCGLSILSHASVGTSVSLIVGAGPDTYLHYALPQLHAISFATGLDRHDDDYAARCPGDLPCAAATHLGRNGAGVLLPAGTLETVDRSPVFTASSGRVGIVLINDVNLSVCYLGTSSCPAYAQGAQASRGAGATVSIRQVVTRLNSDGAVCATTASPWQSVTITTNAHHRKIFLRTVSSGFAPGCGSSLRIRTSVDVRWLFGNPVRIDPEAYRTTGIIMER